THQGLRVFDELVELAFEADLRLRVEVMHHVRKGNALERCAGLMTRMQLVQEALHGNWGPGRSVAALADGQLNTRRRRKSRADTGHRNRWVQRGRVQG